MCCEWRRYKSATEIDERHRHRYEVNPDLVPSIEEAGMQFVGRDETGRRMEVRDGFVARAGAWTIATPARFLQRAADTMWHWFC